MVQKTIAILGASADRTKFGNIAVRAYLQAGFEVYPINPKRGKIEGLPTLASIREIPLQTIDRVSCYLPPPVLLSVLPDVATKVVGQLWLNPGSESPEVFERARELALPVVLGCSIVDIGKSPADFF